MSCAIKVLLSKNNIPSYKGYFLRSSYDFVVQTRDER